MSKSDGHWFSHDNNTSLNPKIICLEAEYGFAGSGRYWRLLEIIHTQEGYKYGINDKVGYAALVKQLGYTTDELKQYLNYCIDIDLVQTDGEYIWSDSQVARMEYWGQKRQSYSERGKKGAAVKKEMQAKLGENDSVAEAELNEKQANETKPNKTKPNETTPNNNTVVVDEVCKEINSTVIELPTTHTTTPAILQRLEQLKQDCIDDVFFRNMYTLNMDIPVERFTDWLSAFNKWLAYTGDTDKDKHHYRLHLRNWLNQHNLNREDPKQYSPVGQQSFSKPVVRSTGEMPKKTAQQIIAENAAYEEELIRKLKAM